MIIISRAVPNASDAPNANALVMNAKQFDQKAMLPDCVREKQRIPHVKRIAIYNNSAGKICVCKVAALTGWVSAADADTINKNRVLFMMLPHKLILSGYDDDRDNGDN